VVGMRGGDGGTIVDEGDIIAAVGIITVGVIAGGVEIGGLAKILFNKNPPPISRMTRVRNPKKNNLVRSIFIFMMILVF
jgi:hypothetical protein